MPRNFRDKVAPGLPGARPIEQFAGGIPTSFGGLPTTVNW